MMGWAIISLVNSGGLEGKRVLFSCSLEELSLMEASEIKPCNVEAGRACQAKSHQNWNGSKQNGSNQHEDKNINLRVELPSLETFQSRLTGEVFFFPFGKSKNP